jgi:deoxyribonuclease-1
MFKYATLAFVFMAGHALAYSGSAPGQPPENFSQTKSILKRYVEKSGDLDYYCGCPIVVEGKRLTVDLQACGYEVRKNPERAARVEFEHVVPAYDMGRQRQCWQQGGRKNCTDNDPEFSRMEADPINLLPTVGEVNGDRSNMRYGMLSSTDGFGYGQCGTRIDFPSRTIMPRADSRGDIARIYFYFQQKYGIAISRQQSQLFTAWSKTDPVDARECNRNYLIYSSTGMQNPYVSAACTN